MPVEGLAPFLVLFISGNISVLEITRFMRFLGG